MILKMSRFSNLIPAKKTPYNRTMTKVGRSFLIPAKRDKFPYIISLKVAKVRQVIKKQA